MDIWRIVNRDVVWLREHTDGGKDEISSENTYRTNSKKQDKETAESDIYHINYTSDAACGGIPNVLYRDGYRDTL